MWRHKSMETSQLKEIAEQSRLMRDMGAALLCASVVLALFLLVPFNPMSEPVAAVVEAVPPPPDAYASVSIEASAAIVYDLVTGETLYAKNADAQLPLASLTKLLSVYSALSELSPETLITIPPEIAEVEAPRAFNAGQILSLSDLARLTLTASLNDGAAAIIDAVATRGNRTQAATLALAADSLNLTQTYAVNGSGLDVSTALSGGYGSARDLARLSGALVARAPTIAAATTRPFASATSEGGTAFRVKNTNPIVLSIPRLLLSKTGYTDLAGGNLALVVDVGIGHPVAVVVLGSSIEGRFTDSTALLDATFAHFAGISSP